jgi:small subunit ribosomal protein S6
MTKYETIFIAHPDLVEDEVKGLIEKTREVIENLNGQLIKVEDWGRRKLAYKLKKLTKGYYVLIRFRGNGQVLAELERNLRLSASVLNYQSIRLEEKATEETYIPVEESSEAEGTGEDRNKGDEQEAQP